MLSRQADREKSVPAKGWPTFKTITAEGSGHRIWCGPCRIIKQVACKGLDLPVGQSALKVDLSSGVIPCGLLKRKLPVAILHPAMHNPSTIYEADDECCRETIADYAPGPGGEVDSNRRCPAFVQLFVGRC